MFWGESRRLQTSEIKFVSPVFYTLIDHELRYFKTITDSTNLQFCDYYRTGNTITQHQDTLRAYKPCGKCPERQFWEPRDKPHGKWRYGKHFLPSPALSLYVNRSKCTVTQLELLSIHNMIKQFFLRYKHQ